jgi:hypothetical protein
MEEVSDETCVEICRWTLNIAADRSALADDVYDGNSILQMFIRTRIPVVEAFWPQIFHLVISNVAEAAPPIDHEFYPSSTFADAQYFLRTLRAPSALNSHHSSLVLQTLSSTHFCNSFAIPPSPSSLSQLQHVLHCSSNSSRRREQP